MCYESDDYCEWYRAKVQRAKKPHNCTTCGTTIATGQSYEYATGKFDGDVFVAKTCGACMLGIYRLHVIELAEGCPEDSSWYPPEACREQMHELRVNVRRYAEMPADKRGEHGELMLVIEPMLATPSEEDGQRYLSRLVSKTRTERSLRHGPIINPDVADHEAGGVRDVGWRSGDGRDSDGMSGV